MRRILSPAAGLSLIGTPAAADIARPLPVGGGWPQWAVVAVGFIVFIGLIVIVSRFVRGGRKTGSDNDDGGGIFGP